MPRRYKNNPECPQNIANVFVKKIDISVKLLKINIYQ